MHIRRTALAAFIVAGTGLALAPSASAQEPGSSQDAGVRATGQCTLRSTWTLKAKTDNGRIEVEYEVDSNRVGQTWLVRLTDNGTVVHVGRHVTRAPSGSFEVRRLTANQAGPDVIKGRAVNRATGEVCSGTVTLRG